MRCGRFSRVFVLLITIAGGAVGCKQKAFIGQPGTGSDTSEQPGSDSNADANGYSDSDSLTDLDSCQDPGDGGNQCLEPDEVDSDTPADSTGDTESEPPMVETGDDTTTTDNPSQNSDSNSDMVRDSSTGTGTVAATDSEEPIDATSSDESDTYTETDTDLDTARGTDSADTEDSETPEETDTELSCGEEMVLIPANPDEGVSHAFCMDRFEASRADATSTSGGDDKHNIVLPLYYAGKLQYIIS